VSKSLRARVRFLTAEEGGRITVASDGVRSQLQLGEISTSCVVRATADVSRFDPGIDHLVELHLMFPTEYAHLVDLDRPVVLLEGSRVVARGVFLDEPA
jgi:hypothetical protein